jgi:hypothetical protein
VANDLSEADVAEISAAIPRAAMNTELATGVYRARCDRTRVQLQNDRQSRYHRLAGRVEKIGGKRRRADWHQTA